MRETHRKKRNRERLAEMYPVSAQRVARVIQEVEEQGFRPRIQEAWRSQERQERLHADGLSRLRWGFHNATAPDGTRESLACDLLDDDAPLSPGADYLLALAAAAARHRLRTGILWGLPPAQRRATARAVKDGNVAAVKQTGWDPCHVEPSDLSVDRAHAGWRPRLRRDDIWRGMGRVRVHQWIRKGREDLLLNLQVSTHGVGPLVQGFVRQVHRGSGKEITGTRLTTEELEQGITWHLGLHHLTWILLMARDELDQQEKIGIRVQLKGHVVLETALASCGPLLGEWAVVTWARDER